VVWILEIKTYSLRVLQHSSVRFLFLGAGSTIVDYLIFSILLTLGMHYLGAVAIGYTIGFVFNFIIGRSMVFKDGSKVDSFTHELTIVSIITIFGLGLSLFLMYMLSEACCQLDPLFARLITIGIVFFYNYIARKIFVYH